VALTSRVSILFCGNCVSIRSASSAELNLSSTPIIKQKSGLAIHRVRPRRQLKVEPRSIYVSEDVNALLHGGARAATANFPDHRAHALIDSFIAGEFLSVSLLGDPSKKSPELERMSNVDEVWLICFRKASDNQWRIMGRFSKFNTFIGLAIHKRSDLGGRTKGRKNYELKAEEFIEQWNDRFRRAEPHRGVHWTDYLSGPVKDVDESF